MLGGAGILACHRSMDHPPKLMITKRRLPHWHIEGSVYFVTFRLLTGQLSDDERSIVFDHIKEGRSRFYCLLSAVAMPDHVHMLLKPFASFSLSRIMHGVKGVSARKINIHRGTTGPLWQDESYDRIVRDEQDFIRKLEYISLNPVKAGLASSPEQYAYWYLDKVACFG
jgi:putative transposase